jgi:hypothetical protein
MQVPKSNRGGLDRAKHELLVRDEGSLLALSAFSHNVASFGTGIWNRYRIQRASQAGKHSFDRAQLIRRPREISLNPNHFVARTFTDC